MRHEGSLATMVHAGMAASCMASGAFDMPLDRPYTLRNARPFLLEEIHSRMILDSLPLSFAFPAPNPAGTDGKGGFPMAHRISYGGPQGSENVGATFLLGEEVRTVGDASWTTEGGALITGRKENASFLLDARIFTEGGGPSRRTSYDREEVDLQADDVTGGVAYSSYARYRGNLNLDTRIGRFTAARDAVHWGPGLYGNLAFHQDAVPFNQIRYSASIGPLTVHSLYGELLIGPSQSFSAENLKDRNLYAHRYEIRLHRNVLLGVTEQLVLYDLSRPFLLVPIVPLFIAKGFMYEAANNGNLAADAALRIPGLGMAYAEFLLDDLESPLSMITKDYIQNKWGCRLGLHWSGARGESAYGVVSEWSRIEPWVYSHFVPGTSQTTNLGYPIGSQDGPNSMAVRAKGYWRWKSRVYAGLLAGLLWKGSGPSSDPESAYPEDPLGPKRFLEGAGDPEAWVEPTVAYSSGLITAAATATLGRDDRLWLRLQIAY